MANGNSTAMAGEFHVLSLLYRMGHEPALTLGNAKNVDIISVSESKTYRVSVKSIQGGGKWGVGRGDYSNETDLVFVFLHFKNFKNLCSVPDVWVIPAPQVERMKRGWLGGTSAIYQDHDDLPKYRDRWEYLG